MLPLLTFATCDTVLTPAGAPKIRPLVPATVGAADKVRVVPDTLTTVVPAASVPVPPAASVTVDPGMMLVPAGTVIVVPLRSTMPSLTTRDDTSATTPVDPPRNTLRLSTLADIEGALSTMLSALASRTCTFRARSRGFDGEGGARTSRLASPHCVSRRTRPPSCIANLNEENIAGPWVPSTGSASYEYESGPTPR